MAHRKQQSPLSLGIKGGRQGAEFAGSEVPLRFVTMETKVSGLT